MTENIYITSHAGRLVQGDVFKGNDKNMQGLPRMDKQGNLTTQWYIGVAFPKGPEWDAMWAQIYAVGQRDFPAGDYGIPGFAWKVIDGDDAKHVTKEGFAGHYILKMTSGFCPTVCNAQNQPLDATTGAEAMQKGNFIQVQFSVRGNGNAPAAQGGKPGVFINQSLIRLVGYGAPIATGPTAAEAFGAAPAALPPGASATPLAPTGAMPANPAAPAVAPAPVNPPAPVAPPMAPAVAPGTPPLATASPSNALPEGVVPAANFMAPPVG
jgi:hypothetical protein